jgi:hypothetical protein
MEDKLCLRCKLFYGSQQGFCSVCFKKEHAKLDAQQAVTQIAQTLSVFEETKESVPLPQTHTDRCWQCSRKIGPIPFKCKCQYFFCARHRLPEDHACKYDHRSAGVRKLSEENPQVIAEKFTKL